MVFTFGAVDILVRNYTSLTDLNNQLHNCKLGNEIIGNQKENIASWHMVAFTDEETGEYYGLGIASQSKTFDPHILTLYTGLLYIGVDNTFIIYDLVERQVRNVVLLNGRFVDIVHIQNSNHIIVIHTKGVVVFDDFATELWRHNLSGLESYELEKDAKVLTLYSANGYEVSLRMKNGRKLNR